MYLESLSTTAMEKALGALWHRQQTISHNIANEDTPGYKAKRVDFESVLQSEISAVRRQGLTRRESIGRLGNLRSTEYELENLTNRADGNNVDLDAEYIEMARTQYHYNALQQKINGHYNNLKYIISGGR